MVKVLFLSVLAALLGASLGGCSGARSPEFDIGPGRYDAAFDATREVLREHRFQLERVDAAEGVITTQPKSTAGAASPWDKEQSTLGQEVEDLLNLQRRVVRVSFTEGRGRVEVTVYRMQTPGLRPSSRAIALTHVAVNPQATAQGTGGAYETAISQDTRLAARLAGAIEKRVGRAVVK
jgi:hypothetical protein